MFEKLKKHFGLVPEKPEKKPKSSPPAVRKLTPKNCNLSTVVVMEDQSEITMGRLMMMAGGYVELSKQKDALEKKYESVLAELHRLQAMQQTKSSIMQPSNGRLSPSKKKALDYIRKHKLPRMDPHKHLKKIGISRSNAYKILPELEAASMIMTDGDFIIATTKEKAVLGQS